VPPALALRPSPDIATTDRPEARTRARGDKAFEARIVTREAAQAPGPVSLPQREARAPAPAAVTRAPERKVRAKPRPRMLALRKPQPDTFKVPPSRVAEAEPQRAPESAAKTQPEESAPAVQSADQSARREAEEAARVQAEAQRTEEAKKQEDARRQALEAEARKRAEDVARQEADELERQRAAALQKEQEAKKLEQARRQEESRAQAELAKKEEEAKRIAIEMEGLKRAEELARQQAAARQRELEAQRQADEAAARAKEAADRQQAEAKAAAERQRLAAPQAPGTAPAPLSGKDLAAKALEQLRTPGAARDQVLKPPGSPVTLENPRRRAILSGERDVSLRMYVDSWRGKIERSGAVNYRPSATWRAHENPVVTVAIRSDGTLEDVWIHKSSGVRELDDAVRRIARLHAPYSKFPPDLARQYDVIEIRRVWFFQDTLRILEEM
jgi:hypothetical protein